MPTTYPPEGSERTTIAQPTHGPRALFLPGVITGVCISLGLAIWLLQPQLGPLVQEELVLFIRAVMVAAIAILGLQMVLVWSLSRLDDPFVWHKQHFRPAVAATFVGGLAAIGFHFGLTWIVAQPWVCLGAFTLIYVVQIRHSGAKHAYLMGISEEYYGCHTRQTVCGHPLDWDDALLPLLVMLTACIAFNQTVIHSIAGMYVLMGLGGLIVTEKTERLRDFTIYDPNITSLKIDYRDTWLRNTLKLILRSLNWISLMMAWLGLPLLFTLLLPPAAWQWWACAGCAGALLVPLWIHRIRSL